MHVDKAGMEDIAALVRLRISYLAGEGGGPGGQSMEALQRDLPGYFQAHLNRNLFAFVVREGETIVSCALLLLVEKPMSPAFPNGRTGQVLNVYTCPDFRRRGFAARVMEALLAAAREMEISVIELKTTEAGYPLYRAAGFADDQAAYHRMIWRNEALFAAAASDQA